jgi:cytochrome c oxidase subunit II
MNFLALPDLNKMIGLPELASENGHRVDTMMNLVTWFMLVLFVGWSLYLIYVLIRYRQRRNAKADYVGLKGHATTHLEIGVVIVEAILLVGFALPFWAMQVDDNKFPDNANVVKIRAMGEKFTWTFQYAGLDGNLGKADPFKIAPPITSVGIDLDDPNSLDDFENGRTMKVPINRPVIVEVVSKDVIHNLHLLPMRVAQDATPGQKSHIWFLPNKLGEWDIICGQLCGSGHGTMSGLIEVVSEEDWDKWVEGKSTAKIEENRAANSTAPPVAANSTAGESP